VKRLQIGTRITLSSAAFAALGLVLLGIGMTVFVHRVEIRELDAELATEARHFLDQWRAHGGPKFDWAKETHELSEWMPAANPPRRLEAVDSHERVLFRSDPLVHDALRGLPPGFSDVATPAGILRVAVFREDGLTLRLAGELAPASKLPRQLALAFVFALPAMLGFVFLGGRWIARKALAPIQEVTAAAEAITAQRLDQRLPVSTARDEIHRLATVLNSTLDRLDQSFQQATRFTADASHELKTPLTVLRTSVEALLHSPGMAAEDQAALADILEQTKRLATITQSLLLLSRADAGKLRLDLQSGDLREVAELCVEDAGILAEERGISISAELPPSAPARLDRTHAAQIVMNLLDNAVKYNHEGGQVRLTLRDEAGHWRLTVANTGPGIPPEVASRVFDRFFRAEHTAAVEGQGLGLSLSRELARAHGGDLALAPKVEGWTAFVLTLPSIELPTQ